MNKEEILQRSRDQKKDEGREYFERKGISNGFILMCLIYAFVAIFNLWYGHSSETFYAVSAIFWSFLACSEFESYKFTKNVGSLVSIIAGSIAAIVFFANYIISCMR